MNNIDVVFSFDTTSSMRPCIGQLRRDLKNTLENLFETIPGLRIGIIAHGDHMNKNDYIIKIQDLTDDKNKLINFVNTCGDNAGGGWQANYNRVLHDARSLSWQAGKKKVLVVIGDEVPQKPNFIFNDTGKSYDYKNELNLLLEMGINVYGVHCLPGYRTESKNFYKEIAEKTKGFYITLEQFSYVADIITAICYKQEGDEVLNKFQEQTNKSGKMNRNVANTFGTLLGIDPIVTYAKTPLDTVPAGKFQVLDVGKNDKIIKDFVQENGLVFKTGRGYYEFLKTETIQERKEVVLMEKKTGDLYSGTKARALIGLLPGQRARLKPTHLQDYRVFVQSTSYNRKLKSNTGFLYQVNERGNN